MSEALNWNAAAAIASTFVDQWGAAEPGGAVIGFDRDGFRFAHAGGVESLATLTPFTTRSVSRYASVTKHAFCTMVLAYSHLVDLEDPLGLHLPELQEPLASVTVGQALDMSGGLPDTRECLSLLGLSVYTETKTGPLLQFIARQNRLNYEAGTEVSYSNTGYRLVEAALERKGVYFRNFIRDLGRQVDAAFDAPEVWNDAVEGLVPGYWHDGSKWQLSAAGLHISASGSLTGSTEGLANWLCALMAGEGAFAGLLEKLCAPRKLADGRESGYGLGLRRTILDGRVLTGHGGSHPGYKTYFLLDPSTGAGFVVVSNREDANGHKIALECMAAVTGLSLPRPSAALAPGVYAAESGPWWISVDGSTVTYLDAGDTVYEDSGGWVSSRSASSPMLLKMDGDGIVGEIGHAVRRFGPARIDGVPASLAGRWESTEGAFFELDGADLVMGVGPNRHHMPLTPLGNGRYLFTLRDGPWTKRVCLHMLADDRLELVLSRARMVEYRRAG